MKQMNDDFMNDASDEYLLRVTNQLKEELQDIKVSEELIARTLELAKEKGKLETRLHDSSLEQGKYTKEATKVSLLNQKRTRRWITVLASAIAACFVLVIGTKVLFFGQSSSNSSEGNMNQMAEATVESANEESEQRYTTAAEDTIVKDSMQEESPTVNSDHSLLGQENATAKGEALEDPSSALTATNESESKESITSDTGKIQEITGMSVTAYEDATAMGAKKEQILVYQKVDEEAKVQSLLELFSSEQMHLTSEEATDAWDSYMILSMEDSSAILYRIGNNQQVAVNVYGHDGKSQDVVYEVKDMKLFRESLQLIINESK